MDRRIIDRIDSLYYSADYTIYNNININSNTVGKLSLTLPLSGTVEVPIGLLKLYENFLVNSQDNIEQINIAFNTIENYRAVTRASMTTVSELFTLPTNSIERIPSGFYIGKGMIFNNNLEPLLVLGTELCVNKSTKELHYNKIICRVSPKAFEGSNFLSKWVKKSGIFELNSLFTFDPFSTLPKELIIGDFKNFKLSSSDTYFPGNLSNDGIAIILQDSIRRNLNNIINSL